MMMFCDIEGFEAEGDGTFRFDVRVIRDTNVDDTPAMNPARSGACLGVRMAQMMGAAADPTPVPEDTTFEVSLDLTREETERSLESRHQEGTDGKEGTREI